MAVELTRQRLRAALAGNMQPVRIPPMVMLAGTAAIIAICVTSLVLGISHARRDADDSQRRFADAQALLAVPPVDTSVLEQKLNDAKSQLAAEQAFAADAQIDPASDAEITLLVQRSEQAGVQVQGISRIAPSTAKIAAITYDLQGIRMTVEGTPAQLIAFLDGLRAAQPGLIPTLAAMTVAPSGTVHADIGFNVYRVAATPAAAPPPARKAAP